MYPVVIVERMGNDPGSVGDLFLQSFSLLALPEEIRKARAIFIKPNLTHSVFKPGVTTSIGFVRSLVTSLKEMNPGLTVYIGEGEGGYNSFSMSQAFATMGFFDIEKEFPRVKVLNLSRLPSVEVSIDTQKGPYQVRLPEIFFKEIDFSIGCPVPKVHCMTRVSLSFKNQWGCLPDTMRLRNHYMFDNIIPKISELLKFRYAFMDGRFGLDRNGPMDGNPVELNWFVASNSLGAFDMVVSEMMGFDWRNVGHLDMAARYGLVPKREEIEIVGDLESLKRKFHLKRTFWNYLALAAFHSRSLTHLLYLSGLAGPLHDFMYFFRKRPIDL